MKDPSPFRGNHSVAYCRGSVMRVYSTSTMATTMSVVVTIPMRETREHAWVLRRLRSVGMNGFAFAVGWKPVMSGKIHGTHRPDSVGSGRTIDRFHESDNFVIIFPSLCVL